jgi:hypothetical protein
MRNARKILAGKPLGNFPLGELNVDGRILLKEQCVMALTTIGPSRI